MEPLQPRITTTITCVKCGGDIHGGDRQYLVVCPYCGVEYQLSISAVVVEHVDIEEKIKSLVACVTGGNPREREEASLELAKLKDGRIVEPVAEAFKELLYSDDCRDTMTIQDTLRQAIAEIDNPGAVGALTRVLLDDTSLVSSSAAQALEKIAAPSSLEALLVVSGKPGHPARSNALSALSAFQDRRIPGVLVSALDDESYYVKYNAIRSLGILKCRDAVKRIIGILEDTSITDNYQGMPWSQVRMWAAQALGQIGDGAAFKPLVEALRDRDSQVRKWADTGLMYLGIATKDEELKKKITKARDEYAIQNPD